jgi:hypothetical protein
VKIWKSLLVILFFSLGSWGAYEAYQKFILSREINSLELISRDAVFIFETKQADQAWQELLRQPLWTALSRFPAFQSLENQLTTLDSLSGEEGFITKTLRNKQVTVSYHAVGTDNFSLLYTLNFGTNSPQELLDKLKTKVPANTRFQTRKYSNQAVYDVLGPNNTIQWTITTLNSVLLISSSSFVIEEAIRLFLSDNPNRLSDKLGEATSKDTGLGRIILSSKGIAKLLGGIHIDKESLTQKSLESTDYLLALNLQFEDNQLVLKGPLTGMESVDFLPAVQAQLPEFEQLISNRTQAITQINLKDSYESQKIENPAFVPKSTVSGEIQSRLIDRGFFDYLAGEQYFLEMEAVAAPQKNQALLIKTLKTEQAWSFLKEYRDSTEFFPVEVYLENEILFFPEENFPAHLFNGKFTGFEQTFISKVGNLLVMSNSAPGMKLLLDDYIQGNTWEKNPREGSNKILSPTSGYSQTFLLPSLWPSWIQATNPTWSTFLQKYSAELQAFRFLTLRINQNAKGPEGTIVLRYITDGKVNSGDKKSFELASGKQVILPDNLSYGPKVIKNFNDNTEDLIIQDQNNVLYVINSGGEQVYSQLLSGPLVSEAFQIDYFKNGKLQLLLATAEQVYAIDRLGNPLPGFPLSLPDEKISQLNLLDYDQSREYRYFIGTEKGNLWLLDKSGKPLEGWSPLALGEQINGAPFHVRLPGKGDFMVALGKSDKVYLFNRKGESQAGSPIQLPKGLNSPLIVNRTATPTLNGITESGELVEASFTGEPSKEKQLLKANRDDRFRLLVDQKGTTSLVVIEQFNKVQVQDMKEKQLLSLPIAGNQAWVGYFDFGPARKIIAVTDLKLAQGYLYDLAGNLLITSPLQSDGEIQISHQPSSGQYLIRTRIGNTVLEYLIPD